MAVLGFLATWLLFYISRLTFYVFTVHVFAYGHGQRTRLPVFPASRLTVFSLYALSSLLYAFNHTYTLRFTVFFAWLLGNIFFCYLFNVERRTLNIVHRTLNDCCLLAGLFVIVIGLIDIFI